MLFATVVAESSIGALSAGIELPPAFMVEPKCWISDLAAGVHTTPLSKDGHRSLPDIFGNGTLVRTPSTSRQRIFQFYYDTFVARCDESGVIFGSGKSAVLD